MTAPTSARPGRNQPCHCGSGRKYKHCCLEKDDLEAAWRSYAGWRVNYDIVLLNLARLTEAPPAPWVSDRSPRRDRWTGT